MIKDNKLFNATYEQSLRLDTDLTRMIIDDGIKRNRRVKLMRIVRKIYSLLGCFLLLFVTGFSNGAAKGAISGTVVDMRGNNYLPWWFFFLSWFIWYAVARWTIHKRYNYIEVFLYNLNATTYVVWLLVSVFLFFITIYEKMYPFIPVFTYVLFVALTTVIIARSSWKYMMSLLYNDSKTALSNGVDKVLAGLMKYGGGLFIIFVVVKYLFKGVDLPSGVDVIGNLATFLLTMVALIVAVFYMMVPYLLSGYYRYKYKEEYRLKEQMSKEDYYGQKYLKKHKIN